MTEAETDEREPPRSDLHDAIGWTLLGIAVLAGSIAMDRLEQQHINPYTVPGLLPGLLGIAMILLGLVLGIRSWERGALTQPHAPATPDQRDARRRVWVVTALCVGYGVVLIGHGIPFWLASSIYVTASILILQRMSRDPQERQMSPRSVLKALVIGVASSVVTQLVFQEVFLVRMP
ncbi:MAG TPA: tripartite tricarboxylate transporter TctB family protein [Ramlibacter sp.]|nr:tripartite tricarboxylate transporter TctB family protein [Ramlibacter sp.]